MISDLHVQVLPSVANSDLAARPERQRYSGGTGCQGDKRGSLVIFRSRYAGKGSERLVDDPNVEECAADSGEKCQ